MSQMAPSHGAWAGSWHSDAHRSMRAKLVSQMYQRFYKKFRTEPEERLAELCRRVEAQLYRNAGSLDEYKNMGSFEARLRAIVHAIQSRVNQPASGPHHLQNSHPDPGPAGHYNGAGPGMMIPTPSAPMSPMPPAQNALADNSIPPVHSQPTAAPTMIPTPGMSLQQGPPGNMAWSAGNWGGETRERRQSAAVTDGGDRDADMNGNRMTKKLRISQSSTSENPSSAAGSLSSNFPLDITEIAACAATLQKYQKLLISLRHFASCKLNPCPKGNGCLQGRKLWHHIMECKVEPCDFRNCRDSKRVIKHYQKCEHKESCPLCSCVNMIRTGQRMGQPSDGARQHSGASGLQQMGSLASTGAAGMAGSHPPGHVPAPMAVGPTPMVPAPAAAAGREPMQGVVTTEGSAGIGAPPVREGKRKAPDAAVVQPGGSAAAGPAAASGSVAAAASAGGVDGAASASVPEASTPGKMGISEIKKKLGSSLLECFTVKELEAHTASTKEDMARLPVTKSQAQLAAEQPEEEPCRVCGAKHVLLFEPAPKNCVTCGQRIKKNHFYFSHHNPSAVWCSSCFSGAPEDLHVEGNVVVKKSAVQPSKRKNIEHEHEPWVACDACDTWVHMICGLFNKGRNRQDTTFLCPWCLVKMQEKGEWLPLEKRPQSMLSACDLPQTQLSKEIEVKLRERLDKDVADREQKGVSDGLAPTGLTVRVVNVTSKVVEVKEQFMKAFRNQSYPTGFPFKQKVILLFQRIEGVDVLLFVVYVQEYGQDAQFPNQNTVYLSYLDSVKFFRPEGRTAQNDMALRTMVYHEVLLAYMDYAKRLGMNAMYIWSCPPLAGDDYVLYCHPSKQKNPRADKLREWYHTLLDAAETREIVTFRSTLFDTYLPGGKDHAIYEPSALKLPYFEGDFWPGEAETQLTEIVAGKPAQGKKGNKARGKSSGKGKRLVGPVTTDSQLVQRLVDNTVGSHQNGMKEDFIVAHFKTPCSMCMRYCNGEKYVLRCKREDLPKQDKGKQFDGIQITVDDRPELPRHFAVCKDCYTQEVSNAQNHRPSKLPKQVSYTDLAQAGCEMLDREEEDVDPGMDCEIFDSRTSFLSLCQGNHFQFDTLRRAKHSSMMTLYHLHNPHEPAFVTQCNKCGKDIEPGMGWRCRVKECNDYELCQDCYDRGCGKEHKHPLQRTGVDDNFRQALSPEQRAQRQEMMKKALLLLMHASTCTKSQCNVKQCKRVKDLYTHFTKCPDKDKGCQMCRHMQLLLHTHAKHCTNNPCPVPKCLEIRELRRRQLSREQDSRRKQYIAWRAQTE